MDRKALTEKLRSLASDDETRSMASRLRDVIDDVEFALSSGVSQAKVLETLESHGIKFTLNGLNSTLRRIRKKNGKPPPIARQTNISQNPQFAKKEYSSAIEGPAENQTVTTSSSPAELEKIIGNKPDLAALAKLAKRNKK